MISRFSLLVLFLLPLDSSGSSRDALTIFTLILSESPKESFSVIDSA
jgi:hypothetical protein